MPNNNQQPIKPDSPAICHPAGGDLPANVHITEVVA